MCFSGWMDKQTVVRLHNRTLLSNNKQQTRDLCNDVDEPQGRNAEWQKTLYDSLHRTFRKRHNYSDSEQRSCCQGWVDRGYDYEGITWGSSLGWWNFCILSAAVVTQIYTLFYNSQNKHQKNKKSIFLKKHWHIQLSFCD